MPEAVPVVDITAMDQKAADALVEAASTVGFVFVENLEFSPEDIAKAFELSKGYFDQDIKEKEKTMISEDNKGYSKMNMEVLDPETQKVGDPKEAFNFGQFDLTTKLPNQPIPEYFEKNLKQLQDLEKKCRNLCDKLLKLIAMGLRVDPEQGGSEWFASRHTTDEPTGSILRFLYYHGQKKSNPEEQIRAGAHTDYGSVTLLFQKEGEDGLEILSPLTKKWTPVPYVPAKDPKKTSIIINIADLMSFWTAGYLKSSVHRVKFPAHLQESGKDRYSIVYFCHPQNDVPLVPVPSKVISEIKGKGANYDGRETITAKQHLDKRLDSTYGWSKKVETATA